MKPRKVLIALVLATFLPLNLSFAESTDQAFQDVDADHANFQAIDYLKENEIVQGYGDGTFRAENRINRAEFLKIVMEAAGVTLEQAADCYKDVKKDAWYSGYVCTASKKGFVKGYGDGKFRPEQDINFAEASKIIVNGLGLEVTAVESEVWYEKYIKTLQKDKAIPDSIAAFNHEISRGEMAEIVWRVKAKPAYVDHVTYHTIEERELAAETGGKLQQFDSCVELKEHLADSAEVKKVRYDTMMKKGEAVFDDSPTTVTSEDDSGVVESAPSEAGFNAEGAVDYSSTNVQVEGVDEADIVKNDGKYIYLVKDETVRVVQAYPAEEMKELDRVTFYDDSFYPKDMYVDGERLVVIGYSYDSIDPEPLVEDDVSSKMIAPPYYPSTTLTKIYIFDLKDKTNISVLRELSFEGNYGSSRKIDQMVYLVVNKPELYYIMKEGMKDEEILPLYSDSVTGEVEPVAPCDQIRYFPAVQNTNYMIVAGVPIDDPKAQFSEEVVLGSSGNVYASRQNLYVAEDQYPWFYGWDSQNARKEETIVHKFNLGRTDIKYFGKGNVPGHILNQFSMDEYKGNFRIATTIGEVWNTEDVSKNNLYILNENLNQVGSITGIAPGEKIYSVRFMGDRAYMVTFKKVDPFFVLDVSSPTNPQVLGKLKIPGYSDYLHPFDENHIIGFGKEAIDASEDEVGARDLDFAWYQGMKVAMFDVTDVSNPIELHKIAIGDRGTESALLYDHKALLFDKEKGLMAFPVSVAEIPESVKNDPSSSDNAYGDHVYQGAYVYDVSVDGGFQFKGRITHYANNEVEDLSGYYWYGDQDINRILYIGDYLYTVSKAMVKANEIVDLEDVKSVELKP